MTVTHIAGKRAQRNGTADSNPPSVAPRFWQGSIVCVLSHGDARKRRPKTRFSTSAYYGAPRRPRQSPGATACSEPHRHDDVARVEDARGVNETAAVRIG